MTKKRPMPGIATFIRMNFAHPKETYERDSF